MSISSDRKSSGGGGRRRFSLLPRLHRSSSSHSNGGGGVRTRGRRQAFGAVHFKKEKTFKLVVAAIEKHQVEKIEEHLTGIEYSELDPNGQLLHKATKQDSLEIVSILLRHGASVNEYGGDESCAALHVAARNSSLPMVSLLMTNEADVNIRTRFEKRTPLHLAALSGSDDIVRMLLEAGADGNATDIYGGTALHLAARACHVGVVSYLTESGGNIDWYDKEGWTSLHLAAEGGHDVVVSLLLSKNASIDVQSKYGRTPLHWACLRNNVQVISLLLGNGANADIKDLHEKTAHQYASNTLIRDSVKQNMKGKVSAYESSTIGALVDIAPKVEQTETEPIRRRKVADVNHAKTNGVVRMSSIIEEEDDVDADTASSSVQELSSVSEATTIPIIQNGSVKSRKEDTCDNSCISCDILNNNDPKCSVHKIQSTCTDIQRIKNRLRLNLGSFLSEVDQVTRQVTRAMDLDESASKLLTDTFPNLRTLRTNIENFQEEIDSDLKTVHADIEMVSGTLSQKLNEAELKIPGSFKLVQWFCQCTSTSLAKDVRKVNSRWPLLVRALPLDLDQQGRIRQEVSARNYGNEGGSISAVLLLWLQERKGDMTLFLKTTLESLDSEDDLAGYKDDIVHELVVCLAGETAGCPPRSVLSAVAMDLSSDAMTTVAREIGVTSDKLAFIKRLSAGGQGEEHTEIISAFLHAADDMPIVDKLGILTDALIYVGREDLLLVLYQQT